MSLRSLNMVSRGVGEELLGAYSWFKERVKDLERAKRLIGLWDVKDAYFYLQQAVEKAFKAPLLKRSVFVRSHDISLLCRYVSSEYKALRCLSEGEVGGGERSFHPLLCIKVSQRM